MTPDQILATIAMLLAEPSPYFDGLRAGGSDDRYPVTVSACDSDPGALEVEGTTLVCGTANVPENYDKPDGRRIDLKFAVFRAQTRSPALDPLIYLHGGPAAGTLDKLEPVATILFPNHRRTRDIVTFDQRAAALSAGSVQCFRNIADHIVDLVPVHAGQQGAPQIDEIIAPCIAEIRASGADLAAYNTQNNARDVQALMSALGYDEYNLYGISYGTRLALEVLRTAPEGVRAAVLDGVAPPMVRIYDGLMLPYADVLDALVAQCRDESGCDAAFPNLGDTINAAFDRLTNDPMPPARGMPGIDVDLLFTLTFNMRNNWRERKEITPFLPRIFKELSEGRSDTLDALLADNDTDPAAKYSSTGGLSADDAAFVSDAIAIAEAKSDLDSAARGTLVRLRAHLSPVRTARGVAQAFEARSNEAARAISTRIEKVEMIRDYALLQRQEPSRAALITWVETHFYGADRDDLLALIQAMSDDDLADTFRIADRQATIYEQIFGSAFNVDIYACQEDMPWNSREGFDTSLSAIASRYPFLDTPDARAYMSGFFDQCEMFEQHSRDDFHTPITSDVPVLALNGTLDVQTSMHWGSVATATLSNARNLIIPEAGHGTISYQPCANDISVAFLNDPKAELDTSCIDRLSPAFLLPEPEGPKE